MNEWVYKATDTKVDVHTTMILADKRGFLCRSAHTASGAAPSNVSHVVFDDEINIYFARPNKNPAELGKYRIVKSADHDHPNFFGAIVPGTALHKVVTSRLLTELEELEGYAKDPQVGAYTGWALRRIGKARPYATTMFPSQTTLQRYP